MLKLVCFQILSSEQPVSKNKSYPLYEDLWTNYNNSSELSSYLDKQCKNNLTQYRKIKEECNKYSEGSREKLTYLTSNGQEKHFDSTACDFYMRISKDVNGNIKRDRSAFLQQNFNTTVYAVVLLLDNKYEGHIYTWISPKNAGYCLAMGIRNKTDDHNQESISHISHFLFEGVRRFALSKSADKIGVAFPQEIMSEILPSLGFEKKGLSSKILGKGIAVTGYCSSCFAKKNINRSFHLNSLEFQMFERTDNYEDEYRTWYSSGNSREVVPRINGKFSGLYRKYYPNGDVKKDIIFAMGKMEGMLRKYSDEGIITEESLFDNGSKSGISKKFFDSGELRAEKVYFNGEKVKSRSREFPSDILKDD